MKKILILFLLPILLISSLFLASGAETIIVQEQRNETNISDIQRNTNEFLSKDVDFPQEKAFRTLFKINQEEPLTPEMAIVILCIFFGLIIFLQNILEIAPFFDGKAKSIAGSIIISLIIGISGVISEMTSLLFRFANLFNVLERWRPLAIAFAILVVFAFFYGIEQMVRAAKRQSKIDEAEDIGMTAGTEIAKLRAKK